MDMEIKTDREVEVLVIEEEETGVQKQAHEKKLG
jgi:hypothetical protein